MVEMVNTVQEYQHGFVFQMGHGLVIDELAVDTARARHTLHIVSDKFTMIGIYYDRLVKEADGVWRFKRRDYRIAYRYDLAAKKGLVGAVHTQFLRMPAAQHMKALIDDVFLANRRVNGWRHLTTISAYPAPVSAR